MLACPNATWHWQAMLPHHAPDNDSDLGISSDGPSFHESDDGEDDGEASMADMDETNPEIPVQRDILWKAESNMRFRLYLTTMEKHDLEEKLKPKFLQGQVELALACFGKPESRECTKQIWQTMIEHAGLIWEHNEACSSIIYDFSLAKSLLLSSRALQKKDVENPCFCFPRTSIMPGGCFHNRVALGQVPHSSRAKPWYCSLCSICVRCNKSFDCTIA